MRGRHLMRDKGLTVDLSSFISRGKGQRLLGHLKEPTKIEERTKKNMDALMPDSTPGNSLLKVRQDRIPVDSCPVRAC